MAHLDYSTPVTTLRGEATDLSSYEGQVLLIVNTASRCGLTPQYKGLEQLHQELADRGLTVLGFPSDSFKQELDESGAIAEFCQLNYGVSFPMFSKISVNGKDTHPLFKQLKDAAPGALGTKAVKWNFTKFLVDRNGNIVKRFAPRTTPRELRAELEALL